MQVTAIPELSLTAVKLHHDGTGAKYLHLAREDTNNLFRCVGITRSVPDWLPLAYLPDVRQFKILVCSHFSFTDRIPENKGKGEMSLCPQLPRVRAESELVIFCLAGGDCGRERQGWRGRTRASA